MREKANELPFKHYSISKGDIMALIIQHFKAVSTVIFHQGKKVMCVLILCQCIIMWKNVFENNLINMHRTVFVSSYIEKLSSL